MKETPTKYKNLQEAYEAKVERVYHADRYYQRMLRNERKANGVCVTCGRKRMTPHQKSQGIISCVKCRAIKKEKE